MNGEEAIAIIRKEYLCVDRDCDIERRCGKCDLVMPSKEPILRAYKMAIKALEEEPKMGTWINNVNGTYTCDHCGCKHSRSNYCPDCGRRMIKERTVNADNNYSLRLQGKDGGMI